MTKRNELQEELDLLLEDQRGNLIESLAPQEARMTLVEEELTEGGVTKKIPYIDVTLMEVDKRNNNGRVYRKSLAERELKRVQPLVDNGEFFMEVDHPGDGRATVRSTGGVYKSLKIGEDGVIRGRVVPAETAAGKDLLAILRAGGKPGMSARGKGTTTPGKMGTVEVEYVNDDYILKGFDAVIGASDRSASVQALHEREGGNTVDSVKDVKELKEKFPTIYEQMRELVAAELNEEVQEKLINEVARQHELMEAKVRGEFEDHINALEEQLELLEGAGAKNVPGEEEDPAEEEDVDDEDVYFGEPKTKSKVVKKVAEQAAEEKVAVVQESVDAVSERQDLLEETIAKDKASQHLMESLGKEPHADLIADLIAGQEPATIEEADAVLSDARKKVTTFLTKVHDPMFGAGKGRHLTEQAEGLSSLQKFQVTMAGGTPKV